MPDLLREGVALLYRELMEAEVAEQAGAGRYERSEERVATQRLSAAWPQHAGRDDRAGDPEAALGNCPTSWSRASGPSRRC